jgi:uncharacterized ion transporter superfamily protein YfcC
MFAGHPAGAARPPASQDGIEDHSIRREVVMSLQADEAGANQELRDRAVRQLKKKHDFRAHLLVYVLVNAFVVVIWAVTGSGFFWPVFLMAAWGIGLVMNAWDVYRSQDPSEEQIRREMDALSRR